MAVEEQNTEENISKHRFFVLNRESQTNFDALMVLYGENLIDLKVLIEKPELDARRGKSELEQTQTL